MICHLFQMNENIQEEDYKNLLIPVDSVIFNILKKLTKYDGKLNDKNKKKINDYAKKIFKEEPTLPIFLEDLWFWGRFVSGNPSEWTILEKVKEEKIEEGIGQQDLLEYLSKKYKWGEKKIENILVMKLNFI